jgi:hypothetical protein
MRRLHRFTVLLLAMGMCFTLCQPAQAYIDAGSGSYLLQVFFAALFGAAFAVKSSFANIKTMISAWRAPKRDTGSNEGA